MAQYGYSAGQPFGDPNGFTRSTQEWELDNFNQWLRSQPFWQQIKGPANGFNDQQKAQLVQTLAQQGIRVPDSFHIDDAGNFNQKGRGKKIALIAGLAAAGIAAPYVIPALAGAGGAAGGAAAIPALEGGGTLAANLGGAGALSGLGTGAALGAGAAFPSLGGGATLAADLGSGSALPALGGGAASAAGALNYIPPGAAADPLAGASNYVPPGAAALGTGAGVGDIVKKLAQVGIPIGTAIAAHGGFGGSAPTSNAPPELQQLLSMAMKRMADQQPLADAVNQQALAGLPTYARAK